MAKKSRSVEIDFSKADPVAGSRRYDRVPEGTYQLRIKKAIERQTGTDKPALAVTLAISKGPMRGKTIGDLFVLPRKGTDDSIFGVQRLHGMMIAAGIKRQKGKASAASIAKALMGRELLAEVVDSSMPATGSYSERVTSAPQTYYKIGSKEAKEAIKEAAARASEEDEEEEEEEDFDAEEDEDEDEDDSEEEDDEDEEEEQPKKKGKKAKKSKKDVEEEEDDDLYDDDDDDDEDEDDDDEDEEDDE